MMLGAHIDEILDLGASHLFGSPPPLRGPSPLHIIYKEKGVGGTFPAGTTGRKDPQGRVGGSLRPVVHFEVSCFSTGRMAGPHFTFFVLFVNAVFQISGADGPASCLPCRALVVLKPFV